MTSTSVTHSKTKIFLCLLIPPILWAGNVIVGRQAAELIGPFSLTFYRWSLAAVIILILTHKALYQHRAIIARDWLKLFTLGALSVTLFPAFLYLGLNFTSANNAGIIQASMPLGIMLLSAAYGLEKPRAWQVLGLSISVLGVLWVVTRGNVFSLLTFDFNAGDLSILAAVVAWAFYSVLLKKWRKNDLPTLALLACQILFGWLACIPFFLIEMVTQTPTIWQPQTFWIIAYVGIFPSLLSLFFWQQGVAIGGASVASLFVPLISVFAVIFSYIFLGEHLRQYQLMGMLLVFCGLALSFSTSFTKDKAKPRQQP